ncbi:MAG: hypothetical protein GTN62_08805 [Gemmatimonadales bacterium]|nr:hypothetical protein [Gemmatimonadales bacterium]NIN50195.1 hypothetical protein [Gemmatimonadales bacterium]NIP07659.1 hypothetical protein [Gemmatimonadales bacterium]NIR01811.1 hypothetical protein [Gemmatimonadales bacterium]NIS65714.1 hypothetical protein [Gemmatimonadales bacterium]
MRSLVLASAVLALTASPGAAQVIPQPPPQREPQPSDTIKVPQFREEPPISPLGAMWRSLLLPGWGQAVLNRRVTGAVFIFWEGVTLTMTVKSAHQLDYQERIGAEAETVEGKRQEVQDWAVLMAFNHLLAAAEAFVSAQLWDFPADLEMQRLQNGDVGAGVRVYWRR